MFSSRSGRRIKPTASNSKVVDILSKYDVDDSDEDSEDEEYEPAADDTESIGRDDTVRLGSDGDGDGEGSDDSDGNRGNNDGDSTGNGDGGDSRKGSDINVNTGVSDGGDVKLKVKSPEVVAPLMMGFGQTRSGRKIVPSQDFDILYLATKFGVNVDDSDDSNDADFGDKEGPSIECESGSEDIGELSDGDGEGDKPEVQSEDNDMEIGEDDSQGCEVMEAAEKTRKGHDDTYLICSVCLQESLSEEIVSCDKCGWTAHEDCYGIQPSDTDDDRDEIIPWFCDACKMGVHPNCELCPNTGGLFKQTVNGKWVHMVCCLYTPGVSYLQPSELNCVVLDEILPLKWGQKTCNLCENPVLAKTGVCIQCDAGMCRSSFHVTCAMQHGLLCEADIPQEELDKRDSVDDVYFAHCKLHSKKEVIKRKRRKWLAVTEHQLSHTFDKTNLQYIEALKRASKVYLQERQQLISSYVPANVDLVQERFLHNCPTAMKLFAKKAEKMGLSLHVGKKSTVTPKPGLTIEYVQYYNESIHDLHKLGHSIPELVRTQGRLDEDQIASLEKFVQLEAELKKAQSNQKQMISEFNSLCSLWDIPMSPKVMLRGRARSGSSLGGLTKECCVCYESTDNHLMVTCDTCQSLYHIHCLVPPLSKVPKKTKTYGWQCEECCCCSGDELETAKPVPTNVDNEERMSTRTGRRLIKPKYYTTP